MGYKSYRGEVLNALKTCKKEFCEKVGTLLVAESQSITPVLTGTLKKAIVSDVMDSNDGVYIGVSEGVPYALAVEKGDSKHTAQGYLENGAMNAVPKITKVAEDLYKSKMGGK